MPEEGPAQQVPEDADRAEERHDADSSPEAPGEGRQEGSDPDQATGNPRN